MPTFLNPWWALAAAGIAIPALLILYFLKLRRREMEVSSTLLWKKAIQDLQVNAPFQKLRRNLLLILQLLLLALLLAAFARPVMNYTPGAGKTTVLLIDRSASMSAIDPDGRSRLEEAKQRARQFISTMDRGATAMLIAFDDQPLLMQSFTTDTAALRRAVDSITPSDRHTKLELSYQLAEAQMAFFDEELRPTQDMPDVVVYSDGRVLDAERLTIRGNLKYERVGNAETKNIGIVALSAKRKYERPTEVQIFARLANFGSEPTRAQVQLSIAEIDPLDPAAEQWSIRSVVEASLPPQRWTDEQRADAERDGFAASDSVEFTLDITTAALVRVEQMNKEGDALAVDDVAHVVIPPPKPLAILLVTEGNWFTERLIEVMSEVSAQTAQITTPASYEAQVPQDYDVIVFDRGYFPKQLPSSGNFIYFGSVGPDLKIKAARQPGTDQPIILDENYVLDWKRDHPILRGLLGLARGGIARSLQLEVPLESERIVEGYQGPLMVLHREGASVHLVLAFDPLESFLPTMTIFPAMMVNALQYMSAAGEMNLRQSLEPGAVVRVPRPNLERAGAIRSLRLIGPDGSREVPITDAGEFALPPLDRVGVHRTDPIIPQFERFAVNLLSDNESNVLPVDHAPGYPTIAAAGTGEGHARLDLWWWIIACAALPLLFIEWWIYTRRVHL
jgi:hypothetical protein